MIDAYALESYKAGDFDAGTRELYSALLSETMVEYGLEALPVTSRATMGRIPARETSPGRSWSSLS